MCVWMDGRVCVCVYVCEWVGPGVGGGGGPLAT